jgi:hypothetical protein
MNDKLTDDLILKSIQLARKNWCDWCDVFEHKGSVKTNPLLADSHRFASFCKEYSVGRTIRRGAREQLRLVLVEKLRRATLDGTGRSLDELEEKLRPRFGTHGGTRRIISLLSKVAALLRPDRFVAWDTYAKRGVNIVLGRSASSGFDTYAEYLEAFDRAWGGPPGQQIRGYVMTNGTDSEVEREPCFQRRVLDMYLMKSGGRRI